MDIQEQVNQLIDDRPGRELLHVPYDDEALQVHDRVYRSAGATASYLVDAGGERVIINTGMGFEAPHHRRLFDALEKLLLSELCEGERSIQTLRSSAITSVEADSGLVDLHLMWLLKHGALRVKG